MGDAVGAVVFVLLHFIHPVIVFVELARLIRGWKIWKTLFRSHRRKRSVARREKAAEPGPDEQREVEVETPPIPKVVLPGPAPWGDATPKRVTVYVIEF
ncbi:hypothetical protein [Streptomyces naganishii]|nr:hypothetical protein [Streptomyces naganishii]